MKKQKIDKRLRLLLQGLPLAAIVGGSFFPIRQMGQQFLMLMALFWIQVFFIVECFLSGK